MKTRSETMSETPLMSRRAALRVVGGSGFVALTLGLLDVSQASATSPADADRVDTVGGTVAVTSRDMLTVATSTGPKQIRLAEGTRAYSGAFGRVTSARDFITGDMVVAEGVMHDGVLDAASVGSIFRTIEVRVTRLSTDGSKAYTTSGSIDLQRGQLPDESADSRARLQEFARSIRPGNTIVGSGWTDPRDGRRYLLIPATV